NRAAITVERSALALDPDFASPWLIMGTCFGNLNELDSALAALRQALARPDRLPERGRLGSLAQFAFLSGDLAGAPAAQGRGGAVAGALAAQERVLQLAPQAGPAYDNRSFFLLSAGRFSEALESAREAERVSAFGPTQITLANQFWSLIWLGRLEEARHLVAKLRGQLALGAPVDIAAAAGQRAAAESLPTVLRSAPGADDGHRRTAAAILAAAQASRGQARDADQMLRQAQSDAETTHELIRANWTRWDRLGLALYSRGVAANPGSAGNWDSTTAGLVAHGA